MSTTKQTFPAFDFATEVGRLVSGSLSVASDKGYNGVKRETPQYFFALALDKRNPANTELLGKIQNHGWTSYAATPHAAIVHSKITHGPIGAIFPPGVQAPFAWKVEDGDAPEHAGKEGWPGHWILKFAGTFPINCVNAHNQQIDAASIRLGAYVQVAGSTTINGNADHTAGIYLNYRFVRLLDPGQLIVAGPSAAQAFGDAPVPQLPPGAQIAANAPMPGAGAGPGMPPPPAGYGQPQAPAGYPQPGNAPQPPQVGHYTPPPAPAPQHQPAHAYAPAVPAGAVQAPGYPPAPTAGPAAPATYPGSYPATAYPSNAAPQPYPQQPGNYAPPVGAPGGHGQAPQSAAPGSYPGAVPHPGFVSGQQ